MARPTRSRDLSQLAKLIVNIATGHVWSLEEIAKLAD